MYFKLKQGEDFVLEINVLDDENRLVDLSNVTTLRVGLSVRNSLVKKYSDVELTGYGYCEIDPYEASKINVFITRDESSLFPIGDLYATVLLEIPGIPLTNEYTYLVGLIERGILKDEIL